MSTTNETVNGITELLADNPSYAGASNQTSNYHLPLYQRGDNYKVLTDQNVAMSILDQTLADLKGRADLDHSQLETVKAKVTTLQTAVTNTTTKADDAIARISELETKWDNNMPTIKSDLIEQNNLIKNLTNRVLQLENTVTSMQTTLTHHASKINQTYDDIIYMTRTQGSAKSMTDVTNANAFDNYIDAFSGLRSEEGSRYLITFTCLRANPIADSPVVVQYLYDTNKSTKLTGLSKTYASYTTDNDVNQIAINCSQQNQSDGNTVRFTFTVRPNTGTWTVIASVQPVCR